MTTDNDKQNLTAASLPDIKEYFRKLEKKCDEVLNASLANQNAAMVAKAYLLVSELGAWLRILGQRREVELLKVAILEYEFALLALMQGHYRHAFRGLRLVLELILQAVYLSANELHLREWIDNRIDTNWSAIVDDNEGVFSSRFAKAFYPQLSMHIQHYRGLAVSLYRECSESVHGNIPKQIPLPSSLAFDEAVFKLWHSKADIVAMIAHFVLTLRYLSDFSENEVSELEPFLSDRLGHIREVRQRLGGVTKE